MRCSLVVVAVVVALATTASADSAPGLALARGQVVAATGDDDAAIAILDDLIARFPSSHHAPDAAIRVLDLLNRAGRFEELIAHAERFESNRALMRHRAFARDLRKLSLRCCFRRDVAPPPVDFEREALTRLDEFAADPSAPDSDELLYEAGWQFCVSHHPDAAARAWRVLIALFPASELVPRARIGLGDLATCTNVRTGTGI